METSESLPAEAGTVVVGAGIVGCSAAYHLAEYADADVAVVDQGPIVETGGSTLHAPGGLRQSSENKTLSQLAQYSRDLYDDLGDFEAGGSLEVATTAEQWNYIRRKRDYSDAYGVEGTRLLAPEEVREYNKLVDVAQLEGGYHVPGDGQIRTVDLLETLCERAADRGATFHEHTTVTDVRTADGRVEAVVTDSGEIACERVLVAANIWSPLLGEMVGVDVPIVPCEHQYVVTDRIDELAGATAADEDPGIRHQEASIYLHQHGEGYGIGSYDHAARLLAPEAIPDHEDAIEDTPVNGYAVGDDGAGDPVRMPATRPFTEADFRDAWREAVDLFPALDGAAIDRAFNGVFSFSVDGMPVLGEAPAVDGCWIAAAVWITHAGGAGKVVADWMEAGKTDLPTHGCEIERFHPHSGSRAFVTDRGAEQYETVYDVVHPREPSSTHRDLRVSPVHPRQEDLGAEFFDSGGWERPRWYAANEPLLEEYDVPDRAGWEARYWSPVEGAEHRAVRDRVGLCDLSNLTPVEIEGPDALACVQRIFTNDLDAAVGAVTYTTMVDPGGGILGDMPVVRRGRDRFLVSAAGGTEGAKQARWIRDRVPDDADATVTTRVSGRCAIGLWGPRARDVLEPLTETSLADDDFPYFTARELDVGSVPALALRVSYVGELGWELHVPTEYAAGLWDRLREAGEDHGIVPMGTGALNTMRLEKGYRLFGQDIRAEYTPYEAGLGFTVDLETPFVGREALARAAEADVARRLTPMTLEEPGAVVLPGMPILDGDERLGYATSADYGYSIDRGIVYGYLPVDRADPGTRVAVRYENERYDATVREEPLFDPEGERLS